MSQPPSERQPRGETPNAAPVLRVLAAVLIGVVGSVVIWVASPYNNFLVGNGLIADDYLPVSAVLLILALVLGINPLLRWIVPRLSLTRRQLAIILAILLVACAVPSSGLMRMLPYMIGNAPIKVSLNNQLAAQYRKMDLPPSLFPDRIGPGVATPVSDGFMRELAPGEPVPWKAWLPPLAAWGVFLVFCWMMMVGLSLIVLPQWRHNERLAFPLLAVEQALIDTPAAGRLLPPLLRRRAFWAAAGAVFAVHFLAGAKLYHPDAVPDIPLKWDLTSLLTAEPWRYFPAHIRSGRLYFAFVGIAFFMPSRISFSIWFTILAYGFYRMIGQAYFQPYYDGTINDHRTGAMLAITAGILWIGRAHWAAVFRDLVLAPGWKTERGRRHRDSAALFLLGLAGMFAWLLWVGVPWRWAAALVGFAFMAAILISRVVAETGMPFIRLHVDASYLMKLAPLSWVGPVALYFATVITVLFPLASRANVSALSTQAMALDDAAGPRYRWRMGLGFLALLLVGAVVSGAVNVNLKSHHALTIDGRPVNEFGAGALDPANTAILELSRGQLSQPRQNARAHIAFGAALAGGLYWLCMNFPTWPLHPVGLLLINTTSYGNLVWTSIFMGWLLQTLLVRFGGAGAYRAARSFFLGVIMGELVAALFWILVAVALAAAGQPSKAVPILPMGLPT